MEIAKRLAAKLPLHWQTEIKRRYFGVQIRSGKFYTDEPEFGLLDRYITPGDWAIDVGANIGHYTNKLSELAGRQGRVIALEPVPTTFSLLSSNAERFSFSNVSLLNVAASDAFGTASMSMPTLSTGLTNYYQAAIKHNSNCALSVLALPIDSLGITANVKLIKVDVEGHELSALKGMTRLIKRCMPVLIVETGSDEVISYLSALGYSSETLPNSPNILFKPNPQKRIDG